MVGVGGSSSTNPRGRSGAGRFAVLLVGAVVALIAGAVRLWAEEPIITVRTLPPRRPGQKAPSTAPRTPAAPATAEVRSKTAGSRSTYRAPSAAPASAAPAITTPAVDAAEQARERARQQAAAKARKARQLARARAAEHRRTVAATARPAAAPSGFNTDTPVASLPPGMGNPRERNAADFNSRGHRLLLQGRYAEAEPLLRQSIAGRPSNPTYAYALYNLGWCLMAQGKASEAIRPLRRSAELQPDRWEPVLRLGQAYEQAGWKDHAGEAYARARDLRSGRGSGTASGLGARRKSAGDEAAAAQPVQERLGEAYVGIYNRLEERAQQRQLEARAIRPVNDPEAPSSAPVLPAKE